MYVSDDLIEAARRQKRILHGEPESVAYGGQAQAMLFASRDEKMLSRLATELLCLPWIDAPNSSGWWWQRIDDDHAPEGVILRPVRVVWDLSERCFLWVDPDTGLPESRWDGQWQLAYIPGYRCGEQTITESGGNHG